MTYGNIIKRSPIIATLMEEDKILYNVRMFKGHLFRQYRNGYIEKIGAEDEVVKEFPGYRTALQMDCHWGLVRANMYHPTLKKLGKRYI